MALCIVNCGKDVVVVGSAASKKKKKNAAIPLGNMCRLGLNALIYRLPWYLW